MRLFLAVDPDAGAREALARQLSAVRRRLSAWERCLRWVAPEALHLTVRFLGETPDERLTALTAALGSELPLAPFDVRLEVAGTFSKRREVRTVWLAVGAGRESLQDVHAHLTRRLRAGGWPDENRVFAPHLTIGRVRDRCARRTAALAEAVAALPVRSVGWRADRVVLYSSDLSGARPVYEPRHQIVFRAQAGRATDETAESLSHATPERKRL